MSSIKKKKALYKTILTSQEAFLTLNISNNWMHCNTFHKYFLFIFQMEKKSMQGYFKTKTPLLYMYVKLLPKTVSTKKINNNKN